MTKKETIANLEMIRVAFVEHVTKEQRKLIDDTFDMAIKALKQTNWISVNHHLPSNGMNVIFCSKHPSIKSHSGRFHIGLNSGFYDPLLCTEDDPYGGYWKIDEVIAWMPLPDPIKESEV